MFMLLLCLLLSRCSISDSNSSFVTWKLKVFYTWGSRVKGAKDGGHLAPSRLWATSLLLCLPTCASPPGLLLGLTRMMKGLGSRRIARWAGLMCLSPWKQVLAITQLCPAHAGAQSEFPGPSPVTLATFQKRVMDFFWPGMLWVLAGIFLYSLYACPESLVRMSQCAKDPENHWEPLFHGQGFTYSGSSLVPPRHTEGQEGWWLRSGHAARPSHEGDALGALPAHGYTELTMKNTPQTGGCCAVAAGIMQ